MKKKIYNSLLYLSNNENISKKKWKADEVKFDVWFMITLFVSITLALISWVTGVALKFLAIFKNDLIMSQIGSILLDSGWIFVAVVFFIEAYDSLRHNRPWDD